MISIAQFRQDRWITLLGLALGVSAPFLSAASESSPATVAEAVIAMDLRTLPIVKGAEPPQHRNVAGLSYKAPGTVKEVFEFHQKQLLDRKWAELPGGYVTDQVASATFTDKIFLLSITVFPGEKPGLVSVTLNQHGNVVLARLPVPPGAKPGYAGPVSISYTSEEAVPQTAEACRKLLMAAGWEPYGTAGDVQFFKQNAVRLAARVLAAPAQGGKTVIDYSTSLMSADLPAPAETEQLQYADVTTQLSFDTKAATSAIAAFYRERLSKAGWEATTENPVKIGFKDELIFRNPQKDMLTLEMFDREGKSRISLKHQSAAEVAEIEHQVQAAMAKRKQADSNKQSLPKLAVTLPPGAGEVRRSKNRIEFHLAAGKARAAVTAWRAQFVSDGWKQEVAALEDMAGTVSLHRGEQHLTITYSDTGFLPTEITVQVLGVELEPQAQ